MTNFDLKTAKILTKIDFFDKQLTFIPILTFLSKNID